MLIRAVLLMPNDLKHTALYDIKEISRKPCLVHVSVLIITPSNTSWACKTRRWGKYKTWCFGPFEVKTLNIYIFTNYLSTHCSSVREKIFSLENVTHVELVTKAKESLHFGKRSSWAGWVALCKLKSKFRLTVLQLEK